MKTNFPFPTPEIARRPAGRAPLPDCWFVADWTGFLFVHFSVPPAVLAPHVPFPLDLHEGRAFVSLVAFELHGMRLPGGLENASRWLLRPVSDHPFLNVRTYVKPAGRPGICFLAEWIPNPFSLLCGPLTYGLPYRRGEFATEAEAGTGAGSICVHDPAQHATLRLDFPAADERPAPCEAGSVEEFLLERYTAYTFRGETRRRFEVAHAPWQVQRVNGLRCDAGLVNKTFPWFAEARLHSAHRSAGVTQVQMGRPHRVP